MKEKDVGTLRLLLQLSNAKRKKLLHKCKPAFIRFLCECVVNVLNGNVPIRMHDILPYEKEMRLLSKKTLRNQVRRKTFKSLRGLKLLKAIGEPCCSYLTKHARRRIRPNSKENVRGKPSVSRTNSKRS